MVVMADGSARAIEAIQIGELSAGGRVQITTAFATFANLHTFKNRIFPPPCSVCQARWIATVTFFDWYAYVHV